MLSIPPNIDELLGCERPWGYWEVLKEDKNLKFKIKKLVVYPGKALSLQYHNHRKEEWFVLDGEGEVKVENTNYFLYKGDKISINAGEKHKLVNTGYVLLVILEIQLGDVLLESDIVRLDEETNGENKE